MAKNSTIVLAAIIVGFGLAPAASAQPLGSFRWQLQPYCNVITLAVVQQGGQYQLDGTDDQCGAAQAASVRGMAFQNLNGTIGFGLTIVTAPGGTPVHVDATLTFPGLNGTWRDSGGNTGSFIFGGGVPHVGPRPVPTGGVAPGSITNVQIANNTIGAAQVNTAEVQTRVAGACLAGAIAAIGANGAVTCVPFDGAGPIRRNTFLFVVIPGTATTFATGVPLTTLTFTPGVTGTAVMEGNGYCIVDSLTTGATLTAIEPLVGGVQGTPYQAFAALMHTLQETGENQHVFEWSLQRDFPVVAGTPYTTTLRAWHAQGVPPSANCTGNLMVRVHVGTLP